MKPVYAKIVIIVSYFHMNKRAIKQLKMVIFDVNATLAEAECNSHTDAFNCAFKEAGLAGKLYG